MSYNLSRPSHYMTMTPKKLNRLRASIKDGVIMVLRDYLINSDVMDEWDNDWESWKGPEVKAECEGMFEKIKEFLK